MVLYTQRHLISVTAFFMWQPLCPLIPFGLISNLKFLTSLLCLVLIILVLIHSIILKGKQKIMDNRLAICIVQIYKSSLRQVSVSNHEMLLYIMSVYNFLSWSILLHCEKKTRKIAFPAKIQCEC